MRKEAHEQYHLHRRLGRDRHPHFIVSGVGLRTGYSARRFPRRLNEPPLLRYQNETDEERLVVVTDIEFFKTRYARAKIRVDGVRYADEITEPPSLLAVCHLRVDDKPAFSRRLRHVARAAIG